MSYNPVGQRARGEYERKLKERDGDLVKKGIGRLIKVENGKPVPVSIPILFNPRIRYGPRTRKAGEEESSEKKGGRTGPPRQGGGQGKKGDIVKIITGKDKEGKGAGGEGGEDPVYETITRERIARYVEGLELEFLKPGSMLKREGWTYENISKNGPPSLLSTKHTLEESILRQIVFNPDKELVIGDFTEGDLRFRHPKVKYKKDRDAVLIHVRDISGSITKEELDIGYIISYLTNLWIEKCYKGVRNIYVLHNEISWQATEKQYYSVRSTGGTNFTKAYELLLAMLNGKDYQRKEGLEQEILNSAEKDIYVMNITDGEDVTPERAVELLGNVMPHLTRFCYLETASSGWISILINPKGPSKFQQGLIKKFTAEEKSGKIRVYNMSDLDQVDEALKKFYGKKT
ncbi:MAG: DUF444 family protein [Nanoarchaeota archaeon]